MTFIAFVQTLFEADPKLWQTGSFASAATHKGPLMPFAQGAVHHIKMDLVQLAGSGNTHMVISADSITVDDLRLAYSQIMNNHITEQQNGTSPSASPTKAAEAIPASSPMVARVPEGVLPRRRSDVGSRSRDTTASGLRHSVSNRDVHLLKVPGDIANDRERARAAFSKPSMSADFSRAHSLPGSSAHTSPKPPRSKHKPLPKAKRKVPGENMQTSGELVSLISMEAVPELLDMLPDGAPVLHLVQCPYNPPQDEEQHLKAYVRGRGVERIEVLPAAAFLHACCWGSCIVSDFHGLPTVDCKTF